MAKVTPNSLLLQAISGAIGDLLYYRDAAGNLIVRQKGQRTKPLSLKQTAHHERLKLASAYGNRVKLDSALSAEYRPFCRGTMRPYHAALRDYLIAPSISAIDLQCYTGRPGELISVSATDDTGIIRVGVVIRHATTQVILEQGAAEQALTADRWVYTTTTSIPSGTPLLVEAAASDRPGNLATANMQICVS